MENILYNIKQDDNCSPNVTKETSKNRIIFDYPCVSQTTCNPYHIFLPRGKYRLELWGAEGGCGRYQERESINRETSGKGAYVSGNIDIPKSQVFFAFIGGRGSDQIEYRSNNNALGGYNGGGNGGSDTVDSVSPDSGAAGGGSTDIRLMNEDINLIESLKSRIAVAGAGGGGNSINGSACTITNAPVDEFLCSNNKAFIPNSRFGAPAGTLHGFTTTSINYPGNQTDGSFWKGMDGLSIGKYIYANRTYTGGSSSGCGSGYFGGTTASINDLVMNRYYNAGGSGGSSYISGCIGCRSVAMLPLNKVKTIASSVHYSKFRFRNIIMKNGYETFKDQHGNSEKGHHGHGAISISYIGPSKYSTCIAKRSHSYSCTLIILITSK